MKYSYELFLQQIGDKVRRMRKDRGWSQRDMIVDHGFHISAWQNVEKGKSMSVPTLFRLCEVFDVTLVDLIGELGQERDPAAPMERTSKSAKKVSSSTPSPRGSRTGKPAYR